MQLATVGALPTSFCIIREFNLYGSQKGFQKKTKQDLTRKEIVFFRFRISLIISWL